MSIKLFTVKVIIDIVGLIYTVFVTFFIALILCFFKKRLRFQTPLVLLSILCDSILFLYTISITLPLKLFSA